MESHLDSYFGCYDFSENRKIRFAEMKLNGPAKIYWKNVMHLLEIRRQDPIETWNGMKFKLREKYIPLNYQDKVVDQWQRIHQAKKSALEYVTEFDELMMACGLKEGTTLTLSKFRTRLREDTRREIILRDFKTREEAYQLSLDLDAFLKANPRSPNTLEAQLSLDLGNKVAPRNNFPNYANSRPNNLQTPSQPNISKVPSPSVPKTKNLLEPPPPPP